MDTADESVQGLFGKQILEDSLGTLRQRLGREEAGAHVYRVSHRADADDVGRRPEVVLVSAAAANAFIAKTCSGDAAMTRSPRWSNTSRRPPSGCAET